VREAGRVSVLVCAHQHPPSAARRCLLQGLVQGALAGIRALAQGVGPLLFAQLFAAVTRTDSPLGYHPGAVFWVSCALTAVAAAVAASIDRNVGKGGHGGVPASGLPTSEQRIGEGGLGAGKAGPEGGGGERSAGRGQQTPEAGAARQRLASSDLAARSGEDGDRRPLLSPTQEPDE